ncbi:hypothetical protein P7K49_008946 [Saguinus oedipus]|uniref:Uncharacterized protein n=1 Tax=Saguinus oedipus TaxID=9490 RepID=A0ABQ9VZ53_SAGOE|nr:hypothetical protein P7K49_008946 [Saguinus oedipus]
MCLYQQPPRMPLIRSGSLMSQQALESKAQLCLGFLMPVMPMGSNEQETCHKYLPVMVPPHAMPSGPPHTFPNAKLDSVCKKDLTYHASFLHPFSFAQSPPARRSSCSTGPDFWLRILSLAPLSGRSLLSGTLPWLNSTYQTLFHPQSITLTGLCRSTCIQMRI